MFAQFVAVALLVSGSYAQFTINTPVSAVQCQPALLAWSGGTPPYFLSIIPGNQPTAAALEDLGTQQGTSFTWTVNIQAGTSIGLTLRDSTGALAQSAAFTVQAGSDSSCVGQSASGSSTVSGSASASGASTSAAGASTSAAGASTSAAGASTSAAGATTSAATTSAGATTKPATTTAKTSGSSSGSASSSAETTSSSTSAGSANAAQVGLAAVLGAAAVAMLA